jgi:hypothetical protein
MIIDRSLEFSAAATRAWGGGAWPQLAPAGASAGAPAAYRACARALAAALSAPARHLRLTHACAAAAPASADDVAAAARLASGCARDVAALRGAARRLGGAAAGAGAREAGGAGCGGCLGGVGDAAASVDEGVALVLEARLRLIGEVAALRLREAAAAAAAAPPTPTPTPPDAQPLGFARQLLAAALAGGAADGVGVLARLLPPRGGRVAAAAPAAAAASSPQPQPPSSPQPQPPSSPQPQPHSPPRAQAQAQAQLAAPVREDAALLRIERATADVAGMVQFLAATLVEQSADVAAIAEGASHSRENVQLGNRELREVLQRPNLLRDAVVGIVLALAAVLAFLERWSRHG